MTPRTLFELSPESDWGQRWDRGWHSWRHRSDGGFDPSAYRVEPIDTTAAKSFVVAHHYSHSYPADLHRFGMFTAGDLVGVLVLGVPAQAKVLTSVLPDLEPYVEAAELSRLVLADGPVCPGNSESWFVAEAFRQAAARGVRGVVSFADPVPRRLADGRLLFPGHVGTIYQALNAKVCGRSTARTLLLLPDGTVLNDRSMQKIRKQERGHDHVERKLVGLGARPMRAGERPAGWLADAIDRLAVTRLRHGGNHRYVFALGTKTERQRLRIALPAGPYPKHPDQEAA